MIAILTYSLLIFIQFDLNSTELYRRGNAYYEQGKYGEAIVAYEQVSKRINNAGVYYNLGNSYFKRGMLGKAILNLRRAKFLSPRDSDIAYNLNFARNYRVDKVSSVQSPLLGFLSELFHSISLFESQLLTTMMFVVSVFFLSVVIVYRRKIAVYILGASVFLCLSFLISWLSWRAEIEGAYAIVIAAEVRATSGPGSEYKEIIVVHDGTEVSVRETRSGYALIQLPGGVGGWVPTEVLEYIF
jgi:tetratricopeptide (TPR) repeat protein